jgi:hypothetical protein
MHASDSWEQERRIRITASKVGKLAKMSKEQEGGGDAIQQIQGKQGYKVWYTHGKHIKTRVPKVLNSTWTQTHHCQNRSQDFKGQSMASSESR